MKNPPLTAEFESLVEAARKGDEKACGRLIQLTQNRLLRFCVYLCGNREFGQDLCQETYLKAFKSLSSLDRAAAFQDWLFRIAKNVFLDSVRSQPQLEAFDPERNDEATDSDLPLILAVQAVLSQFEADDRTLLILIEIEQYAYSEAAEIIGVSEDAVRSRLHRLRKLFLEKWQSRETK